MQTELMQTLRWMRLFGDTIFAIGAVAFVWFALNLMLRKGETKMEAAVEMPKAA
jgi:nitric oxide reductase subunit B